MQSVLDNTIDALNNLLETCKDREMGYRTAAEAVEEPGLRTLFEGYQQQSAGYARELAAVVSLSILEGRWKAIKVRAGGGAAAAAAGGEGLTIAVEFRGMNEWQDISRRLAATPGVEDLEVVGLSARGARVTLRYAGDAEQLSDILAQQGLVLRNAGGGLVLGMQ